MAMERTWKKCLTDNLQGKWITRTEGRPWGDNTPGIAQNNHEKCIEL